MLLTRQAPAKVNLVLDVLGEREDGYHDMRMILQSVSLADTVTLEEAEAGFSLSAEGLTLPAGKKTLEQRAAEAFFAAIGQPVPGLRVRLEKRIPAYAGMGGGSSDVAALLHLLRQRYAPELPLSQLEEIGLTVGSDVPFCVRGGACLAEGRGERLTDLPSLPDCILVICKPDFGLPTPEMFRRLPPTAKTVPDVAGMAEALRQGDLAGVAKRLGNVFESVLTEPEAREIQTIKAVMLQNGALNAVMTGSGPTVFGIFSDEAAAGRAEAALKARYSQVFSAHPLGAPEA